jgi:DivIVA domain-containing protein
VTDLRPARFSATWLRWGYDSEEVDAFLEDIRETFLGIREPFLTSGDVRDRQFSVTRWRRGYDVEEVDALLDEVEVRLAASPPGQPQDSELGPDAYGLRIEDRRTGGRTYLPARPSRRARRKSRRARRKWRRDRLNAHLKQHREECQKAWDEFDQQPGTHLRLECKATRLDLRSADLQTTASMTHRLWRDDRVSISKGSFVLAGTRFKGSSWIRSWRSRKFVDETGTPVLYVSGSNFHGVDYHGIDRAGISFPDGRSLRFQIRGTGTEDAIMTMVDEAGNRVARYRMMRLSGGHRTNVKVAVYPGWELTDELILAIMISAPWLSSHFIVPSFGGG